MYDKSKNYYLVAYDECNDAEAFRQQEGRNHHESFRNEIRSNPKDSTAHVYDQAGLVGL